MFSETGRRTVCRSVVSRSWEVTPVSSWDDILRALTERPGNRSPGQHLVDVAQSVLRGQHASVTAGRPAHLIVLAATDDLARELDEQQVLIGHGPVFSVIETGMPTVVADTADDLTVHRWPVFGPVLRRAGIGSLLSFPLVAGGDRIGAVTSYRTTSWHPDPDTYTDGLVFAALATDVALQVLAESIGLAVPGEAEPSLRDRAVVQQAVGITAEQLGISVAEAMIRLRAHAFATDQRLAVLARRVVSGETALEP